MAPRDNNINNSNNGIRFAGKIPLSPSTSHNDDDNNQPPTRKKSVSFHPKVQVKNVLHHQDYTPEERAKCWFSDEDFNTIYSTIQVDLCRLNENASIDFDHQQDEDRWCARGLERLVSSKAALCRRKRTSESIRAVVDYYQIALMCRRHTSGATNNNKQSIIMIDPERLVEIYSPYTKRAGRSARSAGVRDAVAASIARWPSPTCFSTE